MWHENHDFILREFGESGKRQWIKSYSENGQWLHFSPVGKIDSLTLPSQKGFREMAAVRSEMAGRRAGYGLLSQYPVTGQGIISQEPQDATL